MVDKPDQPIPTHSVVPKNLPPPSEPARMASGSGGIKAGSPEPSQRDAAFKLPEKVSQKDMVRDSFRYGGGRSAGKLSTEK